MKLQLFKKWIFLGNNEEATGHKESRQHKDQIVAAWSAGAANSAELCNVHTHIGHST